MQVRQQSVCALGASIPSIAVVLVTWQCAAGTGERLVLRAPITGTGNLWLTGQAVYVKFVGTHRAYDDVDVSKL